ncbi:MAG TPA: hypothetical protein VK959_02285 [Methylophilaceae bacterium]|nr:hypothetical protein [Methylophilaceae bacterium]
MPQKKRIVLDALDATRRDSHEPVPLVENAMMETANDTRVLEIDYITTSGVQAKIGFEKESATRYRHLVYPFGIKRAQVKRAFSGKGIAFYLIPIPGEVSGSGLRGKS